MNNYPHNSSSRSDSPSSTSVSSNSPSQYPYSPPKNKSSGYASSSKFYPSRNEDMILTLSKAIDDTIGILQSNHCLNLFQLTMQIRWE